ncbi:MAG TPA: serine hydrolase domain-containing protein [Verrucomicrobiae bacterium]|nr:serine hydrolase domain-containing protein [Verrucomicrobiae bacterium]
MRYALIVLLALATLAAEPTPAYVDSVVRKVMASTGVPAVSLAIVRHGTIVYEQAYGYRNVAQKLPATVSTTFPIGSVSKQFLAATMVAMAREGALSLDDPLSKYEPSYTDASQITIAELLAHEAGIRDYYPLDYPTLESYHPISMQALADRYGHLPLDFAPGTRWQYSNSGYTIAGVIAQRVAGAPLFDVYRRRFFAPLGMTSAHWIDGGFGPTDATGYTSYFFGPYEVAPVAAAAWLNAAGSLSMTAHDLATWTIALMEHRAVPAADTAVLWQPRLLADKENPGYGLGFSLGAFNGHWQVAHGGELVGYQSSETMFPDDDTSIIVFANATPSDVSSTIAHTIAEYIYGSAAADAGLPDAAALTQTWLANLAHGRIDRSSLTADFNAFMTPQRIAEAAASLAPLGTPEVENARSALRGGLVVNVLTVTFKTKSMRAILYRTPEGKIAELFLL